MNKSPIHVPTLKWENPPPARHGQYPASKYAVLFTELRKHPGRWAKIMGPYPNGAFKSGTAVQRRMWMSQYPGTEVTVRNRNGWNYIWARYKR